MTNACSTGFVRHFELCIHMYCLIFNDINNSRKRDACIPTVYKQYKLKTIHGRVPHVTPSGRI